MPTVCFLCIPIHVGLGARLPQLGEKDSSDPEMTDVEKEAKVVSLPLSNAATTSKQSKGSSAAESA